MNPNKPLRGEIWDVDFEPVRGHERGENRPVLVISADTFNAGPADLVTVIPLTSKDKRIPLHVAIAPPEGGLKKVSYALPEQIRTVSKVRLVKGWGPVSDATLAKVAAHLRMVLDLQEFSSRTGDATTALAVKFNDHTAGRHPNHGVCARQRNCGRGRNQCSHS